MKSTISVQFGAAMPAKTPFDLKFTSREVTAWSGLALLKRMLDGMGLKEAVQSWDLPYSPAPTGATTQRTRGALVTTR
jgi:hypothetical protein